MSLIFPRRSLLPLHHQMNAMLRAFDEPFGMSAIPRFSNSFLETSKPALDVHESAQGFKLEAELPGFAKKDLSLSFSEDGQTLTLSGEQQSEVSTRPESKSDALAQSSSPEKPGDSSNVDQDKSSTPMPNTIWSERHFGSFRRSLRFPHPVDPANTKASLLNGILTIQIPKKTGEGAKQIQID